MWMQILIAAGFEFIGDEYPDPWGTTLREANPKGFFESQLLAGVYHATNPHPKTGDFLPPRTTRHHVVKVFVPGVVRSDLAYLDNVVGTIRNWREYVGSMQRLASLGGAAREREIHDVQVDHALRWWIENFALIRDIAARGYPAHVTTYDRLLRSPEAEVRTVLRWVGRGDKKKAVAAVDANMRTQLASSRTAAGDLGLDPAQAEVFDELYGYLNRGEDLPPAFVRKLNETDEALRPRISAAREEARRLLLERAATVIEGGRESA